jgi:hypothetical protein
MEVSGKLHAQQVSPGEKSPPLLLNVYEVKWPHSKSG